MLISLIFLVVVVFLITRLLQGPSNTRMSSGANEPTAMEILDQRYARGEITRKEYLTIRDDMTRGRDA